MDYRKLLQLPQSCVHRLINHHLSWLGLAATLPLFGLVTAFAVAPNGDKPEPQRIDVETVTQRLALPVYTSNISTTPYWRDEQIQRGETLGRLLNRLGVGDGEAQRFLNSSPLSRNLLKLKAGQTLSVQTNDAGELFGLRFLNDDENGEMVMVAIEKANGEWRASADPLETQAIQTMRSVSIESGSASVALSRAGVPSDIRAQLNEIFADRFDLASLKPGDRINLVFESLLFNGTPIANGNLLAAEIERSGQSYRAYYFAHDSESGAYYDENGNSIKKGFSQQPVSGARISSGFGMRYHPVLHSLRMHKGVDYAAGTGTPIIAPADGVITTAETQNGYGNVVVIRHNTKMSTLYGHMSRFAAGMRAGKSVKAGELIGYVGSTGRSTGPHLHFEVRINDEAVDPSTAALPTPGLSASQRLAFRQTSVKLSANLKLLRELPVTVAQLD